MSLRILNTKYIKININTTTALVALFSMVNAEANLVRDFH